MGAGLQRGLETMQSGIIQQGLTDADRKFQSEKLQLQMDHAERLQRGTIAAHAEEGDKTRSQASMLQGKQQEFLQGIEQQKEGADIVKQTGINAITAKHVANEEQKIKNDDSFHRAYLAVLRARPTAGGVAAEKKMNESDKEAIKAITNAYDGYVKLQQIPGIDPEKFDNYEVLKTKLLEEALTIGGHATPPSTAPTIKDRFSKMKTPTVIPKSPSLLNTPQASGMSAVPSGGLPGTVPLVQ